MQVHRQVCVRLDEKLQSQDRALDRSLQHFEVLQPEGGRRTRSQIRQTPVSRSRRNTVARSGPIKLSQKRCSSIVINFETVQNCKIERFY
jgi:hypothetical protein